MEFRFRTFRCKFDFLHLVQLFLTGHGHVPCGDPGFIPCHEIFQLADFLLLSAVGRLQLCFLDSVNFLKMRIVAYIAVEFLIFHVVNDVDNVI